MSTYTVIERDIAGRQIVATGPKATTILSFPSEQRAPVGKFVVHSVSGHDVVGTTRHFDNEPEARRYANQQFRNLNRK